MARPSEDRDHFVLSRRRFFPFAPQFEERVQPEVYRFAGKVRFLVVAVLIFFDVSAVPSVERLGCTRPPGG